MSQCQAALDLLEAGISVIPIGANKVPAGDWREFTQRLPTREEITARFHEPRGIGRVCGAVSGNMEVIDFDLNPTQVEPGYAYRSAQSLAREWARRVNAAQPGLVERLNITQTPRPGFHATYRCESPVDGNRKLAKIPGNNPAQMVTIIETRGEGGYALSPGSPEFCHPLGGHRYQYLSGPSLVNLAVLTAAERQTLIDCACSFDETPQREAPQEPATPRERSGTAPGEHFASSVSWSEILTPHGFALIQTDAAGVCYWKRPGSSNRWSATTGYGDQGLFYAFSPNCGYGIEAERGYNKFSIYTLLNHSGNFEESARALRQQGYGEHLEEIPSGNMDAILSALQANSEQPAAPATPAAPTPVAEPAFPAELLRVPGIVDHIIRYNLATAFVPQPVLALAGALAFMGALVGRKTKDPVGTHGNVYLIGLAPSGRGKDHARKVNKLLADCAGCTELIGQESFASGSGLLSAVAVNPSQLFQVDEIGRMLQTVAIGSKSPHLYEIITNLMKLFTSSGSKFLGNAYADAKKNIEIDHPNCNLYGTTVPESFFSALTVEGLTDGFMSRLMVFEGATDVVPQRPQTLDFPPELTHAVQAWADFQRPTLDQPQLTAAPITIPRTPEADSLLWDFQLRSFRAGKNPVEKALWARAAEKANKLSLLYACSESYHTPEIGEQAACWAIRLSEYLTQRVITLAADHVAENAHDRDYKRLEKIIRERGAITLTELSQKARFLPVWQRNQIVEDLIQRGLVNKLQDDTSGGRPKVFLQWELN